MKKLLLTTSVCSLFMVGGCGPSWTLRDDYYNRVTSEYNQYIPHKVLVFSDRDVNGKREFLRFIGSRYHSIEQARTETLAACKRWVGSANSDLDCEVFKENDTDIGDLYALTSSGKEAQKRSNDRAVELVMAPLLLVGAALIGREAARSASSSRQRYSTSSHSAYVPSSNPSNSRLEERREARQEAVERRQQAEREREKEREEASRRAGRCFHY